MADKTTKYLEIEINEGDAIKDLTKLQTEIDELKQAQKELAKETGKGTKEFQENEVRLKALQKEYNSNRTALVNLKKSQDSASGSIKQMRETLATVSSKWAALSKEERENTEYGKKLTKQKAELTKALKREEAATGDNRREVGNYGKALGALNGIKLKTIAIIGAGVAIFRKISQSVKAVVKDFSNFVGTMAKVAAVSGASLKEISELSSQARELGRTSQNSASQVASLQVELSKLGFDPKEIIDATKAINNLSIATGEDLARSAKVVAGNVKAFGLEAKDAGKVADIMAKGFSSSALDLEKFETATAAAGTVLKTAGESVETMTAQLGVLVDRNLDASTAGTSLRNMYLELSKRGIELGDAFRIINSAADPAAASLELFGKRGATAGVILAQNQAEVAKLTTELENSAGAATEMANIMADNLSGDLKAAESASEGLRIAIGDKLDGVLRGLVSTYTDVVNGITDFITGSDDAGRSIIEEKQKVSELTFILGNTQQPLDRRNAAYKELKKIAPDVVEGIDMENASMTDLVKNLHEYNKNAIQRVALARVQAQEEEMLNSVADKNIEAANELSAAYQMASNTFPEFTKGQEITREGIENIIESIDKYGGALVTFSNGAKVQTQTGRIFDALNKKLENYNRLTSVASSENETLRTKIQVMRKALQDQLGVTEELNEQTKEVDISTIDTEKIIGATRAVEMQRIELRKMANDAILTNDKELIEAQKIEFAKGEIDMNAQRLRYGEDLRNAEFEIAGQHEILQIEHERQLMSDEYERQIMNAQLIGADTTEIEKAYSAQKRRLALAEFQAKASIAADFANNIATLAGKNSKVGKAAAAAATTINALQSATGAYASLAPIPIVGPALGAVAAATALAAGMVNVRKIYQTKSGLPGDTGGGGGGPTGGGTPQPPNIPTNLTAELGQGLINRDLAQQNQQETTRTVLVIDDVTEAQGTENRIDEVSSF